ncbi:hypothetical protein LF599_06725 [Pseudodesulfovibrio thermohalotolerans]|uniref:hypothetical protein n=1 Tax=Pseudodesulfovibrio thermohalotolerans TaxID=2880651 RepID=UPI002442D13E|nr:hypothetical protein [Pseudodesulfovibrio thermohalotolerans]WFS63849.1 hypothetical protein LF599_06725 [Pseudodesulfovibrio thermohalotolerans]
MRKLGFCLLCLILFALAGCQSSLMAKTADGVKPYESNPDKAVIVFMRPSQYGGAVQATVFQYDEIPQFVGIVSSEYKLAYQVAPGKHIFMVMGENADFLEANLAAGYIYYVEVEAHFGFAKARFSLEPIPQTLFDTEDFKKDVNKCSFVTNTPASELWFNDHRQDVIKKHDYYFAKWQAKPLEKKNKLVESDGRKL